MKIIKPVLILMMVTLFFTACNKKDEMDSEVETTCDNSTSEFQSLFQGLVNAGYDDEITMDTEIHEYTFQLSADMEICQIGYQSQTELATTAYLIEIVDNDNSTTIYSDSHVFSDTNISYVSPTSAINLQANTSYTVKRVQTNYTLVTHTIGRLAMKSTMDFPYTEGMMTITSSNFHNNSAPATDIAIPYIDLVLK